MRFVCESCRAQYMINDEKVGPKGVKVRCRKCGYVILVKSDGQKAGGAAPVAQSNDPDDAQATQVMQSPLANAPESTLQGELTNPGAENQTSAAAATPTVSVRTAPEPVAAPAPAPEPAAAPAKVAAPAPAAVAAKHSSGTNGSSGNSAQKLAKSDSLLGADEDEIGAVFDQVLAGGGQSSKGVEVGGEGDRQSTRVLDVSLMRKLAEDSNTPAEQPKETPREEVPQTDWYVAISDKQSGPLTLEALKSHWDNGEIGPDSLCWRQGQGDWLPVSDVKMLASVLAPKPPKPIVMPAAATVSSSMGGASVVSVPVQSAFSAGGMTHTVQSEVQVPMSAAGSSSFSDREEAGAWKPSAASALASLVKDEMAALSKPPPKKVEAVEESAPPRSSAGLLDLPSHDERPHSAASAPALTALPQPPAPAPATARHQEAHHSPAPRPAPVNPYMQNPGATFSAPAMSDYQPQSNRGLIIGIAGGGAFVVLVLIGIVLWLATRQPQMVAAQPNPPAVAVVAPPAQPQVVAQPPVKAPAVVPPPVAQPVAVAPAAAPVAAPVPPPVAEPGTTNPPVANAPPVNPPVAMQVQPPPPPRNIGGQRNPRTVARAEAPPREDPPPKREAKAAAPAGEEDDFAAAFGGSKGGKKAAAAESSGDEAPTKKKSVYVPPAPGGGGEVKDSLGNSDVLEVVLSNKSALGRCADEQHKREPGVAGKLVMKWTIQTSGRTSNVSCTTDEFKGTYMASCVGGLIKGMSFPRHKQQGEPVQFPFKF